MHINRAPCAGMKPLLLHQGCWKLTTEALALEDQDLESDDFQGSMPEFEIADDTYVETRESKTSLEREMTLKAFTESGIHAALCVITLACWTFAYDLIDLAVLKTSDLVSVVMSVGRTSKRFKVLSKDQLVLSTVFTM